MRVHNGVDHEVHDGRAADGETVHQKGKTAPVPRRRPVPAALPGVPGYEILEEIGRGSMGVVYKARQTGLGRLVALKMILAGNHASRETLERFLAEARVAASLRHPNIVHVYEISQQQDCPFFSLEFVEGGTLADRLKGRPQPLRQAAQFILTVARAIHVAHQNGIVDRDLKPANILLASVESRDSHVQRMSAALELDPTTDLGMPKITDFGLAKQLHADLGQTESGVILGTPSYMAPEQAEGKSHEVGPAADIYALGAILYEMLTGRPPFTAQSRMETVLLMFQTEPVPPSQLRLKMPHDLETICLKCLRKEPHRRYASAEELVDDLQCFLSGEPIRARPVPLHERAWKWVWRRPALATMAACAVLAVLSLLGLILWQQVDLRDQLGQALQEERAARQAQEDAGERERLGQLRDRLKDLLHAGEAALAAKDWHKAQLELTRAKDQAAGEAGLAEWPPRIEQLLQQATRQRLDDERLEKFLQCRDDALLQATLFTGDDLTAALRETEAAARKALALFGVTADVTAGPVVDSPYYTDQQKTEIVAMCYELLMVLAEAVAQAPPEHPPGDPGRKGEEALCILERAAQLGITTQAYHRRRAQYLAQAGQHAAAEEESRRAAALQPSSVLDHFLAGQEQYRQGNTRQAIRAFENVLQAQPDHFWASYHLALCWLKLQRPNQAIACLTACLGHHHDFAWLYLLRAVAWGELGQFDRAEADFEVALKVRLSDGARYGLLLNRGALRLRQGRVDSAMADFQQAAALRPQHYQAYVNLAQAHLKSQQLDAAVQDLDQAVRREPGLASLYRTRARVHVLRHDRDDALADLDRAIGLEGTLLTLPSPPSGEGGTGQTLSSPEGGEGWVRGMLAEDHLERGRLLHQQKDYSRALAAYDAALDLRPRDARAYRLRADALLELQRLPEALQSLDDCLKYGPSDAGAFRARAALRTRLGQYAGAQTDYTRALEMQPDAATYTARGWCYVVAEAPRLGLPDFEEAIRLAPDQGDAYAGRGFCNALAGKARPAVNDAEEALRRGPSSPRLHYNVARVFAQAAARLEHGPRWTVESWRERALQMLAKALDMQSAAEAARFWQDIVQTDKALNPLRGSPGFRQLAARYPPSPVRGASRAAVGPEP
jgi:tetratricopeptide (TPR) repeat protein